jgi:LuxR family maltose regulon positive regulatory protein
LVRGRLDRLWNEINDRAAIVVSAPRGFGKTTLLAQWRRAWLAQGALVAWGSLDAQDDPARFTELLVLALRAAIGRKAFAADALSSGAQKGQDLVALTSLLANIASLATPTVVVLDDAHRAPLSTIRDMLAYLLHNAPPNLQFVVGTRTPLALSTSELMARGRFAELTSGDLRLDLQESVDLLRRRFAMRLGLDDCVRLAELTEGWPLGLQLAASTIERAPDLHAAVSSLSARHGDMERFFFESMLSGLAPELADFLVRVSMLESLDAGLCAAVTGHAESSGYLEALARDTPIMVSTGGHGWVRVHGMARDFLLGQFDRLPVATRREHHERAARWFADHGLHHEAARHAFAAGDDALALAHAERCLRDIARQGKLAEAREWIRRLPSPTFAKDVHLRLTAAWVMALGDEPWQVAPIVDPIARDPNAQEESRFEAALIGACAAAFCDRPGLTPESLHGWDPLPRSATPFHAVAHANALALLDLHQGATEQVRQRLHGPVTAGASEPSMQLALGFSYLLIGLSYLAEGHPRKAQAAIQPRLEQAERDAGRRSPLAAMLASGLAAALVAQDQPELALSTLADRLDVIEHSAFPDAILLAYRTLADVALGHGDEQRALETLESLESLGNARRMPRLVVFSLAEQARIHALRSRLETSAAILVRLEQLSAVFAGSGYLPFEPYYRLQSAMAVAHLALSRSDLDAADGALLAADSVTAKLRRSREALVVSALRAVVAHRRGDARAGEMLSEALSLAALTGMHRLIEDAHPSIRAMLEKGQGSERRGTAPTPAPRTVDSPEGGSRAQATGGLLTPRESGVLKLLADGMSNKEIARVMDVSDETIKWHLKNLFIKLDAGTRKHAVDRARLLGLIES